MRPSGFRGFGPSYDHGPARTLTDRQGEACCVFLTAARDDPRSIPSDPGMKEKADQ